MAEVFYLLGRDAPMVWQSLGWALLIVGGWGLFGVAGTWAGGR